MGRRARHRYRVGRNAVLEPANQFTYEDVTEKYTPGTEIDVELYKPRSQRQDGLYWAVLKEVIESQGLLLTIKQLHKQMKILTGHAQPYTGLDGRTYWEEESAAWEAMDGAEFTEFANKSFAELARIFGVDFPAEVKKRGYRDGTQGVQQERQIRPLPLRERTLREMREQAAARRHQV